MATRQALRGSSAKLYDIVTNFSRGINTSVADDVVVDGVFRDISNFLPEEQGTISKRKGFVSSNLKEFIQKIVEQDYNAEYFKDGSGDTDKERLKQMYDFLFDGKTYSKNVTADPFEPGSDVSNILEQIIDIKRLQLLNFLLIKDTGFLSKLQNYENLFELGSFDVNNSNIVFDAYFVSKTIVDHSEDSIPLYHGAGLSIYRLHIDLQGTRTLINGQFETIWEIVYMITKKDSTDDVYVTVDSKVVGEETELVYNYHPQWLYNVGKSYDLDDSIIYNNGLFQGVSRADADYQLDFEKYGGYFYAATGVDYLIKLKEQYFEYDGDNFVAKPDEFIQRIGGPEAINTYKPSAIEVSNIGFNLLAKNPLNYIETSGTVNVVKGVFYSIDVEDGEEVNAEPIMNNQIPYNKPFNIHILSTGEGTLSNPQYRPDNGDTDETTNPYKPIPGIMNELTHVFTCSGLDEDGQFEIKITKSDNDFLTYIKTGTPEYKETNSIKELTKLIFSSTKCKIVNNQLVLYGNHGYLFFSEFDNFTYFPNYHAVYVVSGVNEVVTSINYFRQYYAIFTDRQIKRMSGAFGTDSFGIYPLSDFMGCKNKFTIKQINNNLAFVGEDGLYVLKQGYLGEGSENVERIDIQLQNGTINSTNVIQSFVLNNLYIMITSKCNVWYVYNFETDAYFKLDLSTKNARNYVDKTLQKNYFSSFLQMNSGNVGPYLLVPYYADFNFNVDTTDFEYNQMSLLLYNFPTDHNVDVNNMDNSLEFISKFETPYMNLGTPTHTKKFKQIYFKMYNDTGKLIPLFITILVDDVIALSPEDYEVLYDDTTNTYYYVYTADSNASVLEGAEILSSTRVLGELVLGEDKIGNKTVQQLKIRPDAKGRAIKIILSDGYNYTDRNTGEVTKFRNKYDFTMSTIGIVYKLKKVREG